MRIFFRVYIDYVSSHHFAGSQVTYFFQAFTLGERAELFEKIGPKDLYEDIWQASGVF